MGDHHEMVGGGREMSAPYEKCKCVFCVNHECREKRCEWADYGECYECLNPDEEYVNCTDYIDPMDDTK